VCKILSKTMSDLASFDRNYCHCNTFFSLKENKRLNIIDAVELD
jgi:hypothetical protein